MSYINGRLVSMNGKRFLAGLTVTAIVVSLGFVGAARANVQAGPGDNMNYRTRAFVKQMRGCQAAVGIVIQIVQAKPNDLINASIYVNKGKGICSAIRDRMATMDTRHFSSQALDGEVAVDYWARGLGRFSNYIDTGHSSDVAKAAEYFTTARSEAALALRGINQRRAVYGLPSLR
jgi:hypothetical protein